MGPHPVIMAIRDIKDDVMYVPLIFLSYHYYRVGARTTSAKRLE